MDLQRRNALKAGGSLAALGLLAAAGVGRASAPVTDAYRKAFSARTTDEAFARLGAGSPTPSADVRLSLPDIADNGAMVPIEVVSDLPNTEQVAIVIDRNPFPVAAIFDFPEGTLPQIQTRLRIAESGEVHVVVRADGAFHYASKMVRVTIGGCG